MPKIILDVDIDDSAFTAFKRKFDDLQSNVKSLPGEWGKVAASMAALSPLLDKMSKGMSGTAGNATLVGKATIDTHKIAGDLALVWTGISKSSLFFLHDILGATQSLTKWTALTGVFGGLLGAGGLFGIDRMATRAAGQRQTAMGAGVSTGEYSAFLANASRLTSNPGGLMQQFSEGFYSVGAQYSFDTAFGPGTGERMKGKDAASFFSDVLPDIKAKIDATPQNQTAQMLQYSGLGNRGIDLEMANRIRAMSRGEVADISQRLKRDALAMNMPDAATRNLQDFETRLDEAWKTMGTSVENHLVPLLSPLSKLTDNFGKFADAVLKDGGAVDVLMKETADGIESFATKMADPKFRDYVASFAKDEVEAAVLVEVVGKAIAVGVAGFSIAGALRWGPAVAIGGAAVAGGKAFADAPGHALGGSGWDAAKRLWNRLPGYAEGAWNLPKDQLAVVHKGEMVVPAATAETIRQLSDADPNTLNPVADDNSGFNFGNKRRRGPIVKGHQWMHYKTEVLAARAILGNLEGYGRRYRADTLATMIPHYAPAGDGNNPRGYIRDVPDFTGMDPKEHLNFRDPDTRARVAYGFTRAEGHLGPGHQTLSDFQGMFARTGRGHTAVMGHHPAHIGKSDHEIVIDVEHMHGSFVETGSH
jgi:hypothetical protein